jgi:hypothetical protein
MAPIHDAARRGNLAAVNRLVEEDGGRLNARGFFDKTPLMEAAQRGHDAVVARLLELEADVGSVDNDGRTAAHWACVHNHASTLALLLDDGASINAHDNHARTPLIMAGYHGATDCVKLLLARGGDALELNATDNCGDTALHEAAHRNRATIIQLLLQAGANPTIRNNQGRTLLDLTTNAQCIALLQSSLAASHAARALLKHRALIDAAYAIPKARNDAADKGEPPAIQQEKALAAAPAYLKGRVAEGRALPAVHVMEEEESADAENDEQLVACVKYALGLEGGGGWHEGEGSPPQQGMLKEVLVELLELVVPEWDPARKGRPLGEGL